MLVQYIQLWSNSSTHATCTTKQAWLHRNLHYFPQVPIDEWHIFIMSFDLATCLHWWHQIREYDKTVLICCSFSLWFTQAFSRLLGAVFIRQQGASIVRMWQISALDAHTGASSFIEFICFAYKSNHYCRMKLDVCSPVCFIAFVIIKWSYSLKYTRIWMFLLPMLLICAL